MKPDILLPVSVQEETGKTTMVRVLLVACAVVLLVQSGCALRIRQYVEPTTGDTATLIFHNGSFAGSRGAIYEDVARCSGRWSAGAIAQGAQKSVKIKAGQELAFSFYYDLVVGNPERPCSVIVSFRPEPNQIYEAVLLAGHAGKNKCHLRLANVGADGSRYEPVEMKERRPRSLPFDENSDFCHPLEEPSK